jgi:hypothetical protein
MTTLGDKLREAIEKKSVIQTTINAWDAHEDAIRKPQQEKQVEKETKRKGFAPTNNVVRATFDAIKNAPRMQRLEYMEMLELNGHKAASVSSVISQLTRAKQIMRNEDGSYNVMCDEYTPMKQPSKKKVKVVVLDKAPEPKPRQIVIVKKPRTDAGIAALKADTGLQNEEKFDMGKFTHHAPVQRAFHPSAIVDGLTVLHARELYDYLRKIFGGN